MTLFSDTYIVYQFNNVYRRFYTDHMKYRSCIVKTQFYKKMSLLLYIYTCVTYRLITHKLNEI